MVHYIAILPEQHYMCDCGMGINLGIPCWHFFNVWTNAWNLNAPSFHMGLIHARWYKDPKVDLKMLPSLIFDYTGPHLEKSAASTMPPPCLLSNPIDHVPAMQFHTLLPATRTIGAQQMNHKANTALRLMLAGIQTEEELTEVVEELLTLREEAAKEGQGRPWMACITGALKGAPKGGGPTTRSCINQVQEPSESRIIRLVAPNLDDTSTDSWTALPRCSVGQEQEQGVQWYKIYMLGE
ncbi:hypothetical protein FA15DRAFT_662061 [Coprinopsis marcescibilis]|uniref:SWIM-type domain-containing protein n=1 Tax=Coprinopsis marcescibilis TaxID=230819 RepID=A0A5C3K9P5_COPMA|nr:hypothetical protein FA15DRAFT_662061 [Coprinopsis marcescibilis]